MKGFAFTARVPSSTFVWLAISGVVHAFAGRKSFCWNVRLPKRWLQLGREGAVCLACSKALRERAEFRSLV